MRLGWRASLAAALGSTMVLLTPLAAAGHPLGNFTINRFSALEISPRRVLVRYVVDMAEIPTLQQLSAVGIDAEQAAAARLQGFATETARRLNRGLQVSAGGTDVELELRQSLAELRPGQGGLEVLRIETSFVGSLPSEKTTITYRDENYSDRVGWKEIIAYPVDGQGLASSSVPSDSSSNELRSYPRDLLQSPLAVSQATIEVAPGVTGASRPPADPSGAGDNREFAGEWFSSLIERDLSPGFFFVALALALAAGALHALGPGHGKTIMAAYLVGAGGKVRHALAVGIAVSLMHTASVVVLGLVTLWASSLFAPESVYPWLSLASGLVVLALGAWLLRGRLQARGLPGGSHGESLQRPHHHEHHPNREGIQAHRDDQGRNHHHHGPPAGMSPFSARGLAAVALSGGLLPSPAALVVLLGAVALHRVAFGVVLVAAFSVGLAGALTAVGVLVLKARSFAARRLSERTGALIPVVSAAAIVAVGLVLTTRAALSL